MKTTKEISQLINTALSPIIPTYPVVVDALEGNDTPEECAWYRLSPTEILTKDAPDNSGELQVAIVCDSYDRALQLNKEVTSALRLTMAINNVGVQAFNSIFEFSQEDMKHIVYVSTYLIY